MLPTPAVGAAAVVAAPAVADAWGVDALRWGTSAAGVDDLQADDPQAAISAAVARIMRLRAPALVDLRWVAPAELLVLGLAAAAHDQAPARPDPVAVGSVLRVGAPALRAPRGDQAVRRSRIAPRCINRTMFVP